MTAINEPPSVRFEQVSLVPKALGSGSLRQKGTMVRETVYLLKEISFEAGRGDRVALVGPSGAGKTSLLRLLNRLSDPTQGTIYLNGTKLSQIPVVQLRQRVVLVLQESKLLGMTVQQALEYPLRLQQTNDKLIRQRVAEWTERLRIPSEWLSRTELQLSVGQRQMVAIARALIMQPSVLLLDEPTSALDAGRAALLLNVLEDLSKTDRTTIFMVNHQLNLAEQFCDRVLQLQQGILIRDVLKAQVNWKAVEQQLISAEAKQVEEWG
ncbi:ATP-binding cassette domain-containing protein [Kovacikia minuta CCNUW1]|uniref:ABC transporter ATP-binding protein n=1 Tax=Kovacikia minuta TaxID=2931930 RepID=UPI001CCF54A1|nr:ATP-binding cassette domain-containing protein [Kovacikia minuta]UBF29201.1 ATP-binding cassette domain-containing protein [Kovacikia minuta CCNUW1]